MVKKKEISPIGGEIDTLKPIVVKKRWPWKNYGNSCGVLKIFSRKSHYPIETIETVCRSENNELIQVSWTSSAINCSFDKGRIYLLAKIKWV